jgi:hypothetical protein
MFFTQYEYTTKSQFNISFPKKQKNKSKVHGKNDFNQFTGSGLLLLVRDKEINL